MALVIDTTIMWVVAAYLLVTIQKHEIIRSIIVYFVSTILVVSSYEIIILNLNLGSLSQNRAHFIALSISRNITVPLLYVIFTNAFFKSGKNQRIILFLAVQALTFILESINVKMGLYSFLKWNWGYTLILQIIITTIILMTGKVVNAMQLRSDPK